MTTPLTEVLDGRRAADLQKAARTLLKEPLLLAHGSYADEFRLVRQHATDLRDWFERNTGWSLRVDAEAARLRKSPGTQADPTHPAREVTGARAPFTRRRYVLLCLALAALERGESQIALGRLAEQVVLDAADPRLAAAAVEFTLERRDERLDLAAVVRLLLRLGVLWRVAGEEEAYVDGRAAVPVAAVLALDGPDTAVRVGCPYIAGVVAGAAYLLSRAAVAAHQVPYGELECAVAQGVNLGDAHAHAQGLGAYALPLGSLSDLLEPEAASDRNRTNRHRRTAGSGCCSRSTAPPDRSTEQTSRSSSPMAASPPPMGRRRSRGCAVPRSHGLPASEKLFTASPKTSTIPWPNSVGAISTPNTSTIDTVSHWSDRLRACTRRRIRK